MKDGCDKRPRRADARRNYDAILATAAEAFAEAGGAVSIAEIARRAGVGMATVYRNFPSRLDLLEALYLDNIKELARSADDLAGLPPGEALATWLRRFAAYFTTKQSLAGELLEGGSDPTVFSEGRAAIFAAAGPLLERAQQAGDVRADVTVDQMLDLVVGIATIPAPEPGHVERILDIALDGLRAR